MSIRQRTTKLVARRHDLNYFKRGSRLRVWQWMLAAIAFSAAAVWFGSSTFLHGATALSAGPMSSSHAVFGQRCELCHVPLVSAASWSPRLGMRRHVPDSACLGCHVAQPHHPQETTANPTCGGCHSEHIGSTHLAAVADNTCTACHADLHTRNGTLNVAASVTSFAGNHPAFRELRNVSANDRAAAFSLRFDHASHMRPGLLSPDGKTDLQCASCHRSAADSEGRVAHTMAPVLFERSCRSCHSLEFDEHLRTSGSAALTQAPHTTPADVRAFVASGISTFAAQNPQLVSNEIAGWQPDPPLPGRITIPRPRTPAEWIANRTVRAETILWREKCSLCHRDLNETRPTLQPASFTTSLPLPQIEPTRQPIRWFRSAVFSHPAHSAVACAECHTGALTSTTGADIVLPAIATCRKCHDGQSSPNGPPVKQGHAESGCFLCHVYHGSEHLAEAARPTSPHTLPDLLTR